MLFPRRMQAPTCAEDLDILLESTYSSQRSKEGGKPWAARMSVHVSNLAAGRQTCLRADQVQWFLAPPPEISGYPSPIRLQSFRFNNFDEAHILYHYFDNVLAHITTFWIMYYSGKKGIEDVGGRRILCKDRNGRRKILTIMTKVKGSEGSKMLSMVAIR